MKCADDKVDHFDNSDGDTIWFATLMVVRHHCSGSQRQYNWWYCRVSHNWYSHKSSLCHLSDYIVNPIKKVTEFTYRRAQDFYGSTSWIGNPAWFLCRPFANPWGMKSSPLSHKQARRWTLSYLVISIELIILDNLFHLIIIIIFNSMLNLVQLTNVIIRSRLRLGREHSEQEVHWVQLSSI